MIKRYGTKPTHLVMVGFYFQIWQYYLPKSSQEEVLKALIHQIPRINIEKKVNVKEAAKTLGTYAFLGILIYLGYS